MMRCHWWNQYGIMTVTWSLSWCSFAVPQVEELELICAVVSVLCVWAGMEEETSSRKKTESYLAKWCIAADVCSIMYHQYFCSVPHIISATWFIPSRALCKTAAASGRCWSRPKEFSWFPNNGGGQSTIRCKSLRIDAFLRKPGLLSRLVWLRERKQNRVILASYVCSYHFICVSTMDERSIQGSSKDNFLNQKPLWPQEAVILLQVIKFYKMHM